MADKGFQGFPSLAFMDEHGEVLASDPERSVAGFAEMLRLAEQYVDLRNRVQAGDDSATNALFMTELALNKLDHDQAAERFASLNEFSIEQELQVEAHLLRLAVDEQLLAAKRAGRKKSFARAEAIYREIIAQDPKHWQAWSLLGAVLLTSKQYDAAIEVNQELANQKSPEQGNACYAVACAYALKADKDRAFDWLHRSIAAGYVNAPWVERDPDLQSLHGDPRFSDVIEAMSKLMKMGK